MRVALGLRWERAVALLAAILLMMVVALTLVGALPAQAAESTDDDVAVELVVDVSDDGFYGGGSFGPYRASFFTWGNSWG